MKAGSIEFEVLAQNGQIKSALEEVRKEISGLSKAAATGGSALDSAYATAARKINDSFKDLDAAAGENRKEIEKLKEEYTQLGVEAGGAYSKMYGQGGYQTDRQKELSAEIALRQSLIKEIGETSEALVTEEQQLNKQYTALKNNESAQTSLRTQIRQGVQQLAEMEKQGLRGTEAYEKLRSETARLTDAMNDARQQVNYLANDNRGFQGLISAASGVSGAFTAAQGVVGMFTTENEKMAKIQTKVQSLMAITMGLQQAATTLNKDSYFRVVLLTKAQTAFATVTTQTSAALTKLGISATAANVAAKALVGTLSLGLSVAVTAIVALLSKFISKQKEARKETEEFNKAVAQTAAEPVTAITKLAYEWDQLGDSMEEKTKFIEDNRDEFKRLGLAINDVVDAENKLSSKEQIQNFIDAQIAKASALESLQKAQENTQKIQELEAKKKTLPQQVTVMQQAGGGTWTSYQTDNPAIAKIDEQITKLQTSNENLFKSINEENKKVRELTGTTENAIEEYAEGTVGALEEAIKKKNEKLKGLQIDSEEFRQTRQEIENLNRQLAAAQGKSSGADTSGQTKSDTGKDPVTEQLEERKKAYEQYFKYANSADEELQKTANTAFSGLLEEGANYLEYLTKQRDQLMAAVAGGNMSQEAMATLQKLNDAIADETKGTVLAEFDAALQEEISKADSVFDKIELLKQKREELSGDNTQLGQGKLNIVDSQMADAQDELKSQTDALLQAYQSFEDQRKAISEQYRQERLLAEETGNQDLIAKIDEAEAKALSEIASNELMNSEAWSDLFDNLDELTASRIDTLLNEVESKFDSLKGSFNPIDLATIRKKLNEAKEVLISDNPFKQVAQTLKEMFNDAGDDSKDSATKIKKNWTNLSKSVKGSFDFINDAVDSCDLIGDLLGDVGKTALSTMQTMAMTAVSVGEAIQSAEKGSVILAVIQAALQVCQAVANLVKSIIARNDAKIEEKIEGWQDEVDALSDAYDRLQRSIDKALGSDYYDQQKQAIQNLKEQQALIEEIIAAEKSKSKSSRDDSKIKDYEDEWQDLADEIEDTVDEIREDLIGGTAKDIVDQLGSAFIDAFAAGEDAAAAWGDTVNDIVSDIVKNMIIQNYLEKPIGEILDKYASKWYDDEGNFLGYDEIAEDALNLADELNKAGEDFAGIWDTLSDSLKGLFTSSSDSDISTLSGAIKGASQESIDLLAGQTNAIRVNQVEGLDISRETLSYIVSIDSRLGVSNEFLEGIYNAVKGQDTVSDSLRAAGYIFQQ